jgi:fructose-bisphosphate aldolase, class II
MFVQFRDVLADARANRYAVPAFECCEDVMVRTILETCEEHRSPVILQCLEMDLRGNGWVYIPGLVRAVADHHKIPIVLHLDHATTLEEIRRGVETGFSSVMIDGSRLPFRENVELTRAAVDIAHPHGVDVEGELGHVGGMDLEDTQHVDSVLTEADEVEKFVAETGVDALAVSIGTGHGVYRALPVLNIERLKELNAVSSVPLVIHGGSGTPDAQVREAVHNGISKVNVFADERLAMFRGLRKSAMQERPDPLPGQLFGPIRDELSRLIAEKVALVGASDRAHL